MTHVKGGALRLLLIPHEREKGFFRMKTATVISNWRLGDIFPLWTFLLCLWNISNMNLDCKGEMARRRKIIPSKYKCLAFMYFFSCLNPIIYGFMSRSFRESFISDLKHCCCRSCKKRDDSRESSPREIHNIGKFNKTWLGWAHFCKNNWKFVFRRVQWCAKHFFDGHKRRVDKRIR